MLKESFLFHASFRTVSVAFSVFHGRLSRSEEVQFKNVKEAMQPGE